MGEKTNKNLPVLAIIAGGPETRMSSASVPIPLSLTEVGNRPFIDHQLRLVRKNGIKDVVLCLGHLGGQVKEWVQDGKLYDLNISYSFDGPKLLGTGGAIRRALPLLGEVFFVMYGDHFLTQPFSAVYESYLSQEKESLMTIHKNIKKFQTCDVAYKDGKIIDFDPEYPSQDMSYCDYGLEIFNASAFSPWKDGDRFSLSLVQQNLLSLSQLAAFEVSDYMYEIGTTEGYKDFNKFFLKKRFKTGIFP